MSMTSGLRDLLAKMEFLGMVRAGQKLNMSNMSFVESDSWTGSLMRRLFGENRRNTLIEIDQILDQAILAINDRNNNDFLSLIITAMNRSREGISTLAITYCDHPQVVAKIKICLANIDIQLKKNQHLINKPVENIAIESEVEIIEEK